MDAFNTQDLIFAAQVAEATRLFDNFVEEQLRDLTNGQVSNVAEKAAGSTAAFDAKYQDTRSEIARIRKEIEEDHKRLGF